MSFGPLRNGSVAAKPVARVALALKGDIEFPTPGFLVDRLADDAHPLMTFDDGTPAILTRRLGKGRVIQFAVNPLTVSPTLTSPVNDLFKQLHRAVGATVGHEVWRFKLPPLKTKPDALPTDHDGLVCLTNNHVVIEAGVAELGGDNRKIEGGYEVHFMDDGTLIEKPTSLAEGKLTNRWLSYQTRREFREPELAKWTLDINRAANMVFDLGKSYPLGRIVLYYSGSLPLTTVSGSSDGCRWHPLGQWPAHAAGMDVNDTVLATDGSHRYLRIELAAPASPQDKVILSELEIWAHNETNKNEQKP